MAGSVWEQCSLEVMADVAKKKQSGTRLERINLVLRTIRSVDQVLLEEKDRYQLIKGICDSLVGIRGYYNAWIALLDESDKLETYAEAGLRKKFLPMVEYLQRGKLTDCDFQQGFHRWL